MNRTRTTVLGGLMALLVLAPLAWGQAAQSAKPATLKVMLPVGASLEIEGLKTKQTGELRRFESPPLDPAKSYVYTLKATFKDQNTERKVNVKAGEEVEVDLRNEFVARTTTEEPQQKGESKPRPALTVPYVPTPQVVVDKMLEMAKVTKEDVVYDLGCGDGRIVVTAAKKFGAKGVGVDLDPERIKDSKENVKKANVEALVDIREGDVLKTDVSKASVVTLYLLPRVNLQLRPILQKALKPGSRIVSHDFDMGDWKPLQTHQMTDGDGIEHTIYLWEVAAADKENKEGAAAAPERATIPVAARDEIEALQEKKAKQKDEDKKLRDPDVIFVPTHQEVVDEMLKIAGVKKGDVVYDLGCGDGRIPVTAAKTYGVKAFGFDIDPQRIKESNENVKKNKMEELVTIRHADVFTLDLSPASVVTLYLLPELNVKLIPQLDKLKPGSRIVSHDFDMRGLKPDKTIRFKPKEENSREHTIYLWTTPLKKEK